MSAYIIVNVNVTDPERYKEYQRLSPIALRAHGAEVCAKGGAIAVLEGDWIPRRVVMLKFPSLEAAKGFYTSNEYAVAKAAREGAAEVQMVIVEGV